MDAPAGSRGSGWSPAWLVAAAATCGFVALWLLTPLGESWDEERLGATLETIRSSPVGLAGVVVAFWGAAALGFPVTLLIAAIAAAFGATVSVAISAFGVLGAAALGFAAGRWLPGPAIEARLGDRAERVAARVVDRGVLALALLRNIPIAPFALVNVACGATRLGWIAFLSGTLLGMGPGIVLAGWFGQEIGGWLADPSFSGVLRILGVLALMAGLAALADRMLRRNDGRP